MGVRPIRTEEDCRWALAEIEPCFEHVPENGTLEADRHDVLADLISAEEARSHSIMPLSPVEFIEICMERDLEPPEFHA